MLDIKAMRSVNSFDTSAKSPKLSLKWTSKNFENPGGFSCHHFLLTGVPFQKAEKVTKIFAKQVNENVWNHCLNLTKTTETNCQNNENQAVITNVNKNITNRGD